MRKRSKSSKFRWRKRKVVIYSAKQVKEPAFVGTGRPLNQLTALGINYEKKLYADLEKHPDLKNYEIYHNPWFLYNDESYCSPDFILWPHNADEPLIVIECKLKYTLDGTNKLKNLYLPVVRKAYQLRAEPLGIVVAKSLTPEVKKTIHKIRDAEPNANNILLWLGHYPIGV